MSDFKSPVVELEGSFEKPLAKLPTKKRELVEKDVLLRVLWDQLDAKQRRAACEQRDYQFDPALEDQRTIDWERVVVDWAYWEKVPRLTAKEFCVLMRAHDPRKFDAEHDHIPGGKGKTLGERVSDDLRIIERTLGTDAKKSVQQWVAWARKQDWKVPAYLSASADASERGARTATTLDQKAGAAELWLGVDRERLAPEQPKRHIEQDWARRAFEASSEGQRYFELLDKKECTQDQIRLVESLPTPLPTEVESKDRKLGALRTRLAHIEKEIKAIGEAEDQRKAEQIRTCRPVTSKQMSVLGPKETQVIVAAQKAGFLQTVQAWNQRESRLAEAVLAQAFEFSPEAPDETT